MDNTITLPYWVFILITIFALVMVLDRVLLPSMRWYFKRRVNRVIHKFSVVYYALIFYRLSIETDKQINSI